MPVQKIKSGRIITVQAPTYVGEKGMIFYDEDTPELRLSDGQTPGGILFTGGGGGTGTYVLTTATTSVLGGVKIGANVSITADGTISVAAPFSGNYNDLTNTPAPYVLNTATGSILGGVKVGTGLSISGDGTLSAVSTSSYVLPAATTSTLGGIKVGSNLTIDPDGTLNANTATAAASNTFKTIKVSSSTDLVASGEDVLEFVAGNAITITTNPTASPYKTITIEALGFGNLDGGYPNSVYGGLDPVNGGGI